MSDATPRPPASRGSPATHGAPDPGRSESRAGPPRWALLAVIVGAVAVRLWAWSWALQMTNDGVDFLWQAQRLLAGDFELMLRHPYHPLTGALIAALSWLPGGVISGAVAVSALSGALIVLAAHDLARMAFPHLRSAGLWAAVLAALPSRTIIYTSGCSWRCSCSRSA